MGENRTRIKCSFCGRNFLPTRIDDHIEICKRIRQSGPRPYFDSQIQRLRGTPFERYARGPDPGNPNKRNWRKEHEELIEAVQKAKQMEKKKDEELDIKEGPKVTTPTQPMGHECPYCHRFITHLEMAKHVELCKTRAMGSLPSPGYYPGRQVMEQRQPQQRPSAMAGSGASNYPGHNIMKQRGISESDGPAYSGYPGQSAMMQRGVNDAEGPVFRDYPGHKVMKERGVNESDGSIYSDYPERGAISQRPMNEYQPYDEAQQDNDSVYSQLNQGVTVSASDGDELIIISDPNQPFTEEDMEEIDYIVYAKVGQGKIGQGRQDAVLQMGKSSKQPPTKINAPTKPISGHQYPPYPVGQPDEFIDKSPRRYSQDRSYKEYTAERPSTHPRIPSASCNQEYPDMPPGSCPFVKPTSGSSGNAMATGVNYSDVATGSQYSGGPSTSYAPSKPLPPSYNERIQNLSQGPGIAKEALPPLSSDQMPALQLLMTLPGTSDEDARVILLQPKEGDQSNIITEDEQVIITQDDQVIDVRVHIKIIKKP